MEKAPQQESNESNPFKEDLDFLSRFKDSDVIGGLVVRGGGLPPGPSLLHDLNDSMYEASLEWDNFSVKELKEIIAKCLDLPQFSMQEEGYPYAFSDPDSGEAFKTLNSKLNPQDIEGL